jgi:hypothetical protein
MKNKSLIAAILLAALLIVGYMALNAPDQRSTGEKIGDAIGKLDEGVDDAARELEDRTPAERIKDDLDDASDGSPE